MSSIRWLAPVMLFALVAMAVAACGQDNAAPRPTVAPGATLPAAAPAETPVPTERPAASTAGASPAATAPPPAAATATPRVIVPPTQEPESESLRVISSRSMALPSPPSSTLLGLSRGFHGVGASASPQAVPTEGGLTVSAIGSVTVAADEAYIVIMPEQVYSSSGLEQMTDEDRQEIRESLAEIGLPEEAVEFENLSRYEPPTISVEVGLEELAEMREPILEAVEAVIRRYETHGVIYSLTEENCDAALSLARREAIPRAQRAADDLAEALGVSRGAVIGALEYPLSSSVYGLFGVDSNACGAPASSPFPSLVPFDAEPEVEVAVGLQITYGLE